MLHHLHQRIRIVIILQLLKIRTYSEWQLCYLLKDIPLVFWPHIVKSHVFCMRLLMGSGDEKTPNWVIKMEFRPIFFVYTHSIRWRRGRKYLAYANLDKQHGAFLSPDANSIRILLPSCKMIAGDNSGDLAGCARLSCPQFDAKLVSLQSKNGDVKNLDGTSSKDCFFN